ncbi:MAG: hypothetical protein H6724_09940 [Sandaracinus sp.]|nr:hypothetical protein [Sandaracinus sp.]
MSALTTLFPCGLRALLGETRRPVSEPSVATEPGASSHDALRRDESGAIMVMGLFMAVFLVGMLYYLVGIYEAVIFRERMQDSSDAGAFAAAVMNARGMNLIVLLNIVMAIAFAVLIALKLIQIAVVAGLLIAAVACWLGGAGCAAIPPLTNWNIQVPQYIQRAERAVEQITRVCDAVQNAIRLGWPALGQARAVDTMTMAAAFSPPSDFGFVWPVWGALPVENHELRETCDRAALYVGELIGLPFRLIPVIGNKIANWISGAVQGLVSALAVYFCGARPGESSDPPSLTVETTVAYPQVEVAEACGNACVIPDGHPNAGQIYSYATCSPCRADRDSSACADARQQTCTEYQEYLTTHAHYVCRNPDAGCERDADFNYIGPCVDHPRSVGLSDAEYEAEIRDCTRHMRSGADQCRADRTSGLEHYIYVEEYRYLVYYKEVNAEGVCSVRTQPAVRDEMNPNLMEPNARRNTSRPSRCHNNWGPVYGSDGPFPTDSVPGSPWEAACRYDMPDRLPIPGNILPTDPSQEECNALPTRTEAFNTMRTAARPSSVERFTKQVRIVYEISGCGRDTEVPVPVEVGAPNPNTSCDSGRYKCPKRVCRYRNRSLIATACPTSGDDLFLGDNDFQLRSFAFAGSLPSEGDAGVRLAAWGDNTDGGFQATVLNAGREIARISIAQAEFYWDQDEDWRISNFEHSLGKGRIEWMWDMAWRGRLRRVGFGNATEPNGGNGIGNTCSEAGGGGDCGGSGLTSMLGNLFSH